jgi:undecaprenyl diphosphate synthase
MNAIHPPGLGRIPRHIGFIPDGNRRWAASRNAPKRTGYAAGIAPGIALLEQCRSFGVEEVSIYGYTKENVHRPRDQVAAFRDASVQFAMQAAERGAALRVIGDHASPAFPAALLPFVQRRSRGEQRVNLLINYGWKWDLEQARATGRTASSSIPRIDLVVRWGGKHRLSGFLPVQCAYADIFVIDALWPDMTSEDLLSALAWYTRQEITLGG